MLGPGADQGLVAVHNDRLGIASHCDRLFKRPLVVLRLLMLLKLAWARRKTGLLKVRPVSKSVDVVQAVLIEVIHALCVVKAHI